MSTGVGGVRGAGYTACPVEMKKPGAKVGTASPTHPSDPLGTARSSAAPLPCNLLPSPPSQRAAAAAAGAAARCQEKPGAPSAGKGGERPGREGRAGRAHGLCQGGGGAGWAGQDRPGGGEGAAVGREPGSAASTKDGEAPGPRRGGGSALTWDAAEAPQPVVIC